MRKILILIVLSLALCAIAGTAYGQSITGGAQQPRAAFFIKFTPGGISGDQQYLYVMAGGKILQYESAEMTLLRSVDLPDPVSPNSVPSPPVVTDSGQSPPPPPPPPHGLWAGNGSLYVLRGPFVYIYSVPDLTLEKTVELPKPDLPQVGK